MRAWSANRRFGGRPGPSLSVRATTTRSPLATGPAAAPWPTRSPRVVVAGPSASRPPDAERQAVESETGHAVDAVVHRGSGVERALANWQAGAASVGRDVFVPEQADQGSIRHELLHVLQAGNRRAISNAGSRWVRRWLRKRRASLGTVARARKCCAVVHPGWRRPPGRRRPRRRRPRRRRGTRSDAEGNLLSRAPSGAWYLASPPIAAFPIATGYRYQLLPPNPNASFAALQAECVQIRDQQKATATRLKGDGKYWFTRGLLRRHRA
jgi:hypothetical protein